MQSTDKMNALIGRSQSQIEQIHLVRIGMALT